MYFCFQACGPSNHCIRFHQVCIMLLCPTTMTSRVSSTQKNLKSLEKSWKYTHKQLNMENAWKRHDFPSKNLVLNFLVPSKSLFFQLPWSFVSSPGTIWRPSSWLRSFGTRWDLNSDTWFRIVVFLSGPALTRYICDTYGNYIYSVISSPRKGTPFLIFHSISIPSWRVSSSGIS